MTAKTVEPSAPDGRASHRAAPESARTLGPAARRRVRTGHRVRTSLAANDRGGSFDVSTVTCPGVLSTRHVP